MIKLGLSGYFEIFKKFNNGKVVKITEFENMILDSGLNLLATSSAAIAGYCRVGQSSVAPNPAQTSLISPLAGVSTSVAGSSDSSGPPSYAVTYTRTFTFGIGSVVGNVSEIGVSPNSSSNLFSRALIADINGNPMSISIQSDEQLIVTYRHIRHPYIGDISGVVNFDGNIGGSYNFTSRVSNVSSWNAISNLTLDGSVQAYSGSIGDIDSAPSGAGGSSGSISHGTYINNSFQRDVLFSFAPTQGNIASGIKSISNGSNGFRFQIEFDPPIPKTSNDSLSINASFSWGRA